MKIIGTFRGLSSLQFRFHQQMAGYINKRRKQKHCLTLRCLRLQQFMILFYSFIVLHLWPKPYLLHFSVKLKFFNLIKITTKSVITHTKLFKIILFYLLFRSPVVAVTIRHVLETLFHTWLTPKCSSEQTGEPTCPCHNAFADKLCYILVQWQFQLCCLLDIMDHVRRATSKRAEMRCRPQGLGVDNVGRLGVLRAAVAYAVWQGNGCTSAAERGDALVANGTDSCHHPFSICISV